jgi:hypothetical protein
MVDLETILEQLEKVELIVLIKQLLQKQPEMEWEFTMLPLLQSSGTGRRDTAFCLS